MKKVGIIGGGQLGMMLAESLKKKGAYVLALDPNPNCSCSHVCDEIIVGDYGDLDKLKELGDKSDVLTYEFENVPADKLIYLKNTYNIPQGIEPLFDSQNRIREKNNARAHGLKTPNYYEINSLKDLILFYNNHNNHEQTQEHHLAVDQQLPLLIYNYHLYNQLFFDYLKILLIYI